MQVYIIEDEPLSLERLHKQLLEIDADIQIAGTADSIAAAVSWLQQNGPDLILMDIELADGQSFEIFKAVDVQSAVIFTTSYDEFALQAFKVNSIDYLLKPVKRNELQKAIEKYKKFQYGASNIHINIRSLITELKAAQQLPEYRNRFLVKQGQRLLAVEASEIAYFYIEGRLCFFTTWEKRKYIVEYTLEELETALHPKYFFRLNRSVIAHVKAIGQIYAYFNGKLKLELKPAFDDEVLVSRERAQAFKDWMGR